LTPSSRRTSFSGGGRKSLTISSLPNGSSRYFVFRFIDPPASAPVAGTNDPNHSIAVCEADSKNGARYIAETIKAGLIAAVRKILGDNA
jgi:hypothetical protein